MRKFLNRVAAVVVISIVGPLSIVACVGILAGVLLVLSTPVAFALWLWRVALGWW